MKYTTEQIIEKLRQLKVVPVIAVEQAEDILPLVKTLAENGLPVAEITFRSAAAEEAIRLVRQHYPDVLIAAGTVLTAEQVVKAKNAGADFVVTPGFNPTIVKLCQDLDFPITPGVNNPMSIEAALSLGIEAVKFFPAEASGGVKMIKALLGPYGNLQIMPTGGISPSNIKDYLAIPNIVACGGSWFVEKSLIQAKNWDGIGRLVREAVALTHA
ncbi:bifunctional 4-hydroxy-2-oxoglutarate aldolase/2-dehydro-3-deoxy-phosphogluconate aldolase [Actinobacillus pleuropneumoniae]|uniref:bifunctional 4-hydroxy-2-oxoglutarate aldolase/2-dehydro-3-deoxy-phosphogluconate aldolase n=1 Tax=Actinobacillus pleuropneumoniae TaxID=715 RepID=UPI001C02BC4C|nr:bifunctional 4-hydroxy-2-oxoglutarate aldolase/2-dehydro-3-deoxy-phosphogluconate aldolase [Actinobacillus pleuropneumoniae]MBT9319449.1 bifunctional 4-hydroxy-2-oxoglutarate aldolase/2-dehydro-3-deoxy-phosphogluconate aldolase [Actinobacillus pleuropneumoniae]MBT9344266.1 bifunctional 4-hydroxy-2-oxoglutarate aldolase/2-dehydro-3-deoxy-phosphogluconate aldolase [Actinobacillus pleuropneumoniae]UKH20169.1 keto-hydroxyglutarate-aldolase/keto-deoxy-phosphogluconate aldolase [Actinobacillus pleu